MPVIYGNGHVLLSFFDIEYEGSISKITDVLMSNPNARFRLSLNQVPQLKEKKNITKA